MNRDGYTNVDFFVGKEVEHTPAIGMRTLFVVGVHDHAIVTQQVLTNKCLHVYFGANHSFPKMETDDYIKWQQWEGMILPLLQDGWLCTLDLDVSCAEGLVESSMVEYNNFIPMISVKLPYIQLMGYNATIKLDDKDFAATNPGVWCHSLHELRDRKVFTDWSEYTKDEIVK